MNSLAMCRRNLFFTKTMAVIIGYGDSLIDSSARLADGDGFLMEFCEENSDLEDYSLPDDFPEGSGKFEVIKELKFTTN